MEQVYQQCQAVKILYDHTKFLCEFRNYHHSVHMQYCLNLK